MTRKNFAATGSFIAEDRPRALDLLGFSSQLIFNTFHNGRLHDFEHGGDVDLAYAAARAHNRGMLEFCSVDPRLLPTCYVPLVDPDRAVQATTDALRSRGGRPAGRLGLPAVVLAQPHRPLRGLGPGRGGRHPRRLPRGRHRRPDRPELLRQRAAHPPRLPRRATRTSARSTTWASPSRRPRPWPPSSSTGCSSASPACASGSSNRGPSGCPRGSARWSRPSRPSPATRTGCRPCRCGRPSTCTARSASRRIPPRTWAGSSSRVGPIWSCSPPTIPTWKAAGEPLERFEASLGDAGEEVRQQFYVDNFLFLMGSAGAHLAGAR